MGFNKLFGFTALVALSSSIGAAANCKVVNSISYCNAVSEINFDNIGTSGSYNAITKMDPDSCTCESAPRPFGGAAAPLNEELVAIVRGPIQLKRFAVYQPGGGNLERRDPIEHRHHARRHAHHTNRLQRRERHTVFKTVTATATEWVDPTPTADVDIASVDDDKEEKEREEKERKEKERKEKEAAEKKKAEGKKKQVDNEGSSGTGRYKRVAYYDAESGKAEGLVFLNHKGDPKISGTFDYCFGSSLSYASSDAQGPASSPQVLANKFIPSNTEFVIASAASCDDGSCGYVRPGSQAHHGWGGSDKVFVFEFSMPSDGAGGLNGDMPALWLLNQQIVNTLQYGKAECSCWTSGCGELDVFEVLKDATFGAVATLHGKKKGSSNDYFARPYDQIVKFAVVFSGDNVSLRLLPTSHKFESRVNAFSKASGQSSGTLLFDS